MKILMVSSFLPYPLYSGGNIRLYNLIKNLSKTHEITLICEKRINQKEEDIKNVEKICRKVYAVERKKQWSAVNVFKTAVSSNPFLITGHKSSEMKKIIEKLLSEEKFDLIHVETFYVMQNLPAGLLRNEASKAGLPKTKVPTLLVEHNIEYKVYKRYADKASLILKPILLIDVAKIKRAEEYYWKKADKLVAVSVAEANQMKRGDVEVVPNGVDTNKFSLKKLQNIEEKSEKKVLFIGDFKWVQNRDSIVYIIKNIWPQVIYKNKNKSNLKLWVVGKNIPEGIRKLEDPTIIFDENAPNETELIFSEADLLLSPIRVGGGTNFKILESMASGTPVLTTPLGNEGLEANKDQIVICEKPEEFSNKITEILSDNYLYEKISRNGRKFVEENFDWKQISQKLDNIYMSLVK